jgi:hypothetical protein
VAFRVRKTTFSYTGHFAGLHAHVLLFQICDVAKVTIIYKNKFSKFGYEQNVEIKNV